MNYENYFVEVAVGDVSSRNVIIPYHKLSEIVNKNIGKEIYRSMFLYQKSIVNHIEDTGSIKGYEGIQALDKIVFDVDKGTKSNEDLKKQTHKLMRKLVDLDCHPKYINIWFSGRGFHVVIPNLYGFKPSINLAREVKATIARDFGNKTDLIYDSKRLIRLPFSLNKKTNLYKTYLTHTQFLKFSYDEIVEYCEEVRFDMPEAVNGVKTIWEPMKHSKKEVKQERIVLQDATYQTNADVTCGQHIYNKGAAVENRHLTLLRLVSIWRRKGFTQEQCIVLGKTWIETKIAHVDEIIETYKQYIEDAKYNNTFNFKDLVNIKEDYIFTAGDLVILGGNTKIGKTAFVQWIVSQVPDVKTAFLSLEVGENLINRRFFQCIIGLHKDNFKEWNQEYDQYLKEGMNHISVTDESPDIRDYHKIIETYNPKMLVIDTIDTIPVKYYQEEYERQNFVIKELKSLANKYKIIIFGISHISKFAAQQLENGERLGIHSFKGNSVIEQKADKVIGFEQQSDNEKIRIISSLGTRDESPFEVRMLFNYETFSFEQL